MANSTSPSSSWLSVMLTTELVLPSDSPSATQQGTSTPTEASSTANRGTKRAAELLPDIQSNHKCHRHNTASPHPQPPAASTHSTATSDPVHLNLRFEVDLARLQLQSARLRYNLAIRKDALVSAGQSEEQRVGAEEKLQGYAHVMGVAMDRREAAGKALKKYEKNEM